MSAKWVYTCVKRFVGDCINVTVVNLNTSATPLVYCKYRLKIYKFLFYSRLCTMSKKELLVINCKIIKLSCVKQTTSTQVALRRMPVSNVKHFHIYRGDQK